MHKMRNITDLPDDILLILFNNYLNLSDLINISKTCNHFYKLLKDYRIFDKYLFKYPILDLNYPYGYNDYLKYSKSYSNEFSSESKLNFYFNLINSKYEHKEIYSFAEKMLPSIQIDDETNDTVGFTSAYFTNGNKLLWINLNNIKALKILKNTHQQTNKQKKYKNKIKVLKEIEIFEQNDIRTFKKKNDTFAIHSENTIKVVNKNFDLTNKIDEANKKINSLDFSTEINKLIYGCSDGDLKICDLLSSNFNNKVDLISLNDRVLRCVLSPSFKVLAIGTAGLVPHKNYLSSPLRIYDLENLKEIQSFKSISSLKIGDGVLALSFIDENLVLSAGYDTFIRLYDLRSNRCIQSLEDPEDMSIYSVCCSKYYGLISGLDRQSLIRYWDRRANKIIKSFFASKANSSIYSLANTPSCILACWQNGISCIDFS